MWIDLVPDGQMAGSCDMIRSFYRIPSAFQRLLFIQIGLALSASHADVSGRVFKGS